MTRFVVSPASVARHLAIACLLAGAATAPALAAERLWQGEAVVTLAINCDGIGPIGETGSRFHAALNPKLADAEANLTLVLTHPAQTIAFRRDAADGSIFGRASMIEADGSVRTRKALFFLSGLAGLNTGTTFVNTNGFLYDFGKRGCNIGFSAALIGG